MRKTEVHQFLPKDLSLGEMHRMYLTLSAADENSKEIHRVRNAELTLMINISYSVYRPRYVFRAQISV